MKGFEVIGSFVKKNAPTILSWAGITMFAAASAYSIYTTFGAANDISQAEEERKAEYIEDIVGEYKPLTTKEKVSIVWKRYIPSAVLIAGGTTCVLFANHINLLRIEALAVSLALTKSELEKREILDIPSPSKHKKHGTEEEVDDDLPPWVERYSNGTIMIQDGATGRTFVGTKEAVDAGINRFNNYLIQEGKATLNDLFDAIGISECEAGKWFELDNAHMAQLFKPTWTWVDNPQDPNQPMARFSFDGWGVSQSKAKEASTINRTAAHVNRWKEAF